MPGLKPRRSSGGEPFCASFIGPPGRLIRREDTGAEFDSGVIARFLQPRVGRFVHALANQSLLDLFAVVAQRKLRARMNFLEFRREALREVSGYFFVGHLNPRPEA